MAESNGEDVQVPWFSGLCLEGEVAGQYEIERTGSQREGQDATKADRLELDGLSPITIFVGANNSGKSRLLRELFKIQEPLRIKLMSRDIECHEVRIGEKIPDWRDTIENRAPSSRSSRNIWIADDVRVDFNSTLKQLNEKIEEARFPSESARSRKLQTLKNQISKCGIKDRIPGLYEAMRCYVPMLRGMRPPLRPELAGQVQLKDRDLYKSRTERDYFSSNWDLHEKVGFGKRKVFTGLELYGDLRSRLLAKIQADRDSVRKYEQLLSSHFFAGQEVILIPVEESNNDVVHIKIGSKDERPIYDLGDGMQSLIICTYPIVTETEPGSLFFLEEPDLCMHPSLQRTFLEVLKTYHRKMGHQFFITTHSNHLLDLLEDNELVSIFSFSEIADQTLAPADSSLADSAANSQSSKPKPSFRIRPSYLRDRQTLLELGVRPSATFLANATIWVEGVSDCAYLRAYMEAFVYYLKAQGIDWGKRLAQRLERYKEDRHYAFVEYNGSNLEHFSFESNESDDGQAETKSGREISVPDLCATAIVIADGDVREKGERSTWLEEQLNERFICLPGKEIENLIPEALIKEQILYDHSPPKQKRVETSLIELISYASYARSKAGIGEYLGDAVKIPTYQGTVRNGGASGTLPSNYKKRWRCEVEGIPALLRKAINPESIRSTPEQSDVANSEVDYGESIQVPDLPSYLTHDLIWLCVCIYSHVAKCNHDKESEEALNGFQQFIRDQGEESQESPGGLNGGNLSSAESVDPLVFTAPEWPIQNVSSRNCLLKAFLLRSNNAESTPLLNAEPYPESTSSAPGAIAYPAS